MIADLLTDDGRRALDLAEAQADPASLSSATLLRKHVSPELAAAALDQVALRRRARPKFGDAAATLLFTAAGLEQATRPAVAAWRAERLAACGVRRVVDLGCGIGSDARAFRAAGLDVVAVDVSEDALSCTAHNAPGTQVVLGDAAEVAAGLLADAGVETCVFLDPARRTDRGRTWRVDQFSPPWEFVMGVLDGPWQAVVKLGPGVPFDLLPQRVAVDLVSERGDLVEASLWRTADTPTTPGRRAVLLPGPRVLPASGSELEVRPLGTHLLEPDAAIIRAGAVGALPEALGIDVWQLAPGVGYLSCDQAPLLDVPGGLVTCWRVVEVVDPREKALRAWVRERGIGVLEIKKRSVEVDPAALRRRLKLAGHAAATLVLAHTADGLQGLVVERVSGP